MKIYSERVVQSISPKTFFSKPPLLQFCSEKTFCGCGKNLTIQKTRNKKLITREIGRFEAHETISHCAHCNRIYNSDDLKKLVPVNCNFGFDILVDVGMLSFVQYRNEREIQEELHKKNITISTSEIGYLGRKFIIYLAVAHKESRSEIKNLLTSQGGYILHLDGTCEGDSPSLMTVLDGISEIVLGNIKLPSEKAEIIIPFLRKIQQDYGDPICSVHDMGIGILNSVKEVFPLVLDFICHFHFLRDIGKDLFEIEYSLVRKYIKNHRIRTSLRKYKKKIKELIDQDSKLSQCLEECQKSSQCKTINTKVEPTVTAYTLALWALDADSELNGYGFPFDRHHLVFYQRLQIVNSSLDDLKTTSRNNKALSELRSILKPIIRDSSLENVSTRMNEKVKIFDKLREAMRIALPEENKGLKDDGDIIDMPSIKGKVTEFRNSDEVVQAASSDVAYKKMMNQIDKYWKKLFAAPITVNTPEGKLTIQPQRTNNILERFFRDLKKGHRKKSGTNKLTRTLKTMLADSPLVKNLNNKDYMRALLKGKENLVERFAEIDARLVRDKMKEEKGIPEEVPSKLKAVLRMPAFPTQLVKFTIKRLAA